MSDELELKVVNAVGLEPGKVYILEIDRTKVSTESMYRLVQFLKRRGIEGIAVRSTGEGGVKVIEPTPEEPK